MCLEIKARRAGLHDACLGIMPQLTALQRLQVEWRIWPELLPHLASFPSLKDVATVLFEGQDAVESIVALTSLTRLQAVCDSGLASMEPLTRLSALQALSLRLCEFRRGEIAVETLIRGRTQLTELAVVGLNFSFEGFGHVLAPLGCLKRLHLHCLSYPCPISVLRESPLHGLWHLSVGLGAGAPTEFAALCSALVGLERLSVYFSDPWAMGLVRHLSHLTRLSALRLEAVEHWNSRVRASFLTDLTGLVDLKLSQVLAGENARFDIPCLALLTRLRWLVVESWASCLCGCQATSATSVPLRRVLVSLQDLQPLSALRMLESCDLADAWRWQLHNPDDSVRELCKIAKRYVGPYRLEEGRLEGSAFSHMIEQA